MVGYRLSRERNVALVGLVLLICICFSSLLFLPVSEVDELVQFNKGGVINSRDVLVRPLARPRDERLLRDKIEQANIPAPRLHPEDQDPIEHRRTEPKDRADFIKKMMKSAWNSYRQFAWGSNELKPLSKTGHSASIFGKGENGATIVDAIDTLFIMDMQKEYEEAREWIRLSLDLTTTKGDVSVFETNIRFIGGLLSIYSLTNDTMFLDKADTIAQLLLPAFDTPTGIPYALLNLATSTGHNWGWASGGCSILSEFGSLQLEFDYLSKLTGKRIYADKVARIRKVLLEIEKPSSLYHNYLNPKTGKWGQKHVSIGALGDSFYEYLLKSWLITGKRDIQAKAMYDEAMIALDKALLQRSPGGLLYYGELKGSRLEPKMDHLACFVGGMIALQAAHEENNGTGTMQRAKDLAHTCHETYTRTETGIGPESFRFTRDAEAMALADRDKGYILRPEVIESWFYLWRLTGDRRYQDWCWTAALAIHRFCAVPGDGGYSGIRNVYTSNVNMDDVQQSFFLAETLKYLYLVFSDDQLPLDQWVFNTEAHPFRISSKP